MTITAAANTNNITFESSANNLMVTNDLTTGNILFTSERPYSAPGSGNSDCRADVRSTDEHPKVRIKRMNEDGTVDRVLIRRKSVWRFFCQQTEPRHLAVSPRTQTDYSAPSCSGLPEQPVHRNPWTTSTILDFGPDDTLDAAKRSTNTTVLFDNGKETL